jgi:hypothetical protein
MWVQLEVRRGRPFIARTSVVCSIVLGLAGSRAHAQAMTAQEWFEYADRLIKEGKLDAACEPAAAQRFCGKPRSTPRWRGSGQRDVIALVRV